MTIALLDPTTDRAAILHELIAALDRRVPQVHRIGEVGIARAAAALRLEALRRIQELETHATDAGSDQISEG